MKNVYTLSKPWLTLNPISTLLNLGCFLWIVFVLTCLVSNCAHSVGVSSLKFNVLLVIGIHVGFNGA